MNNNGIITADGQKLAAFQYTQAVWTETPEIKWRGALYSEPRYVAEWMEVLDAHGELVGVQLDLVRDLYLPYWQWLHRFPNVKFDEYGGARIHFREPDVSDLQGGPFLPVEAFTAEGGDFVLYVPDLFPTA
jgi:hypothetical protein